jgi:hypothetical protein
MPGPHRPAPRSNTPIHLQPALSATKAGRTSRPPLPAQCLFQHARESESQGPRPAAAATRNPRGVAPPLVMHPDARRHAAATPDEKIPQQRSVVAPQPCTFVLDPQPPNAPDQQDREKGPDQEDREKRSPAHEDREKRPAHKHREHSPAHEGREKGPVNEGCAPRRDCLWQLSYR